MKIAVTPYTISSIKLLSEAGADIFIIGDDTFANRIVNAYSIIEITEANSLIKEINKEIYVLANIIVHSSDIRPLKEYLEFLKELNVDGVVFGDLGTYMLAKELVFEHKLIYNPETLNTNYYDSVFWHKKGIKGLTISKEITLEDMMGICSKKEIELSVVGHGHLNMFHSRRPLIENYFKYTKEEYEKIVSSRELTIIEETRNESYPITQDKHGTHIFREKALESFKEIKQLAKCIDVFIIDGLFKDTDYLIKTVKNYVSILNEENDSLAIEISKQYSIDHDSGFLYKKTQYDKY